MFKFWSEDIMVEGLGTFRSECSDSGPTWPAAKSVTVEEKPSDFAALAMIRIHPLEYRYPQKRNLMLILKTDRVKA